MSHLPPPRLAELAAAHGVATDYWDWLGQHVMVSAESIRAVLAALGVDATTDDAVEASLAEHVDGPWRRTLPASVVVRQGMPPRWRRTCRPAPASGSWPSWRTAPAGRCRRWTGGCPTASSTARPSARRPSSCRPTCRSAGTGSSRRSTRPRHARRPPTGVLVVTPQRLELPEGLRDARAVGLMAQLYQVRSGGSWGTGDLRDLADLATWAAAAHEADFVLVNPLHAAEPVVPMEPSPYLPTTRRFVNPLYLRVEDVPEVALLENSAHRRLLQLAEAARALNAEDRIDRDAAWTAEEGGAAPGPRRGAHRHAAGARSRSSARARARACSASRRGARSPRATGCRSPRGPSRTRTPPPRRSRRSRPSGPTTSTSTAGCSGCSSSSWRRCSARRVTAGMTLGVVHDLAVGVHPLGADAWGLGTALARGVTVGAPPDQFNQLGQNWSQPPWRPDRLAELGYAPVPRHGASGAARLRRHPGRPHHRALPALVDPGRRHARRRAPTSTTTTRRCSASSCSRPSAPARWSSGRTSGWWRRTCATT